MLIEVKAKVAWVIDTKVRRKLETFILDREVFAEAEYAVMSMLSNNVNDGTVESYEILGMKVSQVKEIVTQYQGENTYVASLRDTFLQNDGTEKTIRYKVLLWANNISDAMTNTRGIASQGYDMQIDSLREVNYTYLNSQINEETAENENPSEN